MDVMGSAAAGGDETGRVDEDDESKTGTGTREGAGTGVCVESSCNLRNLTPSLYMAGVIFSRLNGTRPAFSNPAITFWRVVACSHAQRVAAAY